MRLIDADKIKVKDTIGGQNDFADCIRDSVQAVLDNAPTVDAVPISVIEDIRAEIDKNYPDSEYNSYNSTYRSGYFRAIERAIYIINEHIGGKESEVVNEDNNKYSKRI